MKTAEKTIQPGVSSDLGYNTMDFSRWTSALLKVISKKSKTTQLTKLLVGLLLIFNISISLLLCYNYIHSQLRLFYEERNWYVYKEATECAHSKSTQNEMNQLAIDTFQILKNISVTSFACYGTLIGVLQRGSVLPWDNNIDICVVGNLSFDYNSLVSSFKSQNIHIGPYNKWKGHYRLERDGLKGLITVLSPCPSFTTVVLRNEMKSLHQSLNEAIIHDMSIDETERAKSVPDYKKYDLNWICPDGIVPRLAQLMVSGMELPVPSPLVTPPFQSIKFGNAAINVPNGDGKILKSWYPDTWYINTPPLNCLKQE